MDEKWLDVVGFEGLYEVSDQGNLRKIFSTGKYYSMSLNSCDKDGYVKTSLRKDGKRHYLRLHRIIAEAFLDNSEGLPVVNHIDGVKDNNKVKNLEWCTVSENTCHGFNALGRIGHNGGMNKHVDQLDIVTGELIRTYDSITAAADHFGVTKQAISNAIRHNTVSKKFKWRYSEEGVTTIENP